jgi:hypothetical protein
MASAIASTSAYIFPDSQNSASPRFSTRSTSIQRDNQSAHTDSDQTDSDSDGQDEEEYKQSKTRSRSRSRQHSELGQDKPRSRAKDLVCSYEGCGKVYSRQSRLEEHERTHSGEVRTHFSLFLLPS